MGLVHRFGDPLPDGIDARAWLGGKGAALDEMTRLGLPVPPGFTLSTELCRARKSGDAIDLDAEIAHLEEKTGLSFGDASAPLLVSVRSGAPTSMPGMLDTVIDVGASSAIARGLSERFAA